jgi:uncharacterized protein (DUF433 family)
MGRIDWREHITIDSNLHHGDPCIKGTRIPVATIVGSLADGMTVDEIVAAFPQLNARNVQAALSYAAEILKQEILLPLAG